MIDLRMEYPRPLLERKDWFCLNGQWEFEMDTAEVGKFKKYWERPSLNGEITVPYCPESKLSGIGHTDFIGCCWYRKTFTLPESFAGKRTILHFGAVDYIATVWVNGCKVGSHKGGYTPFSFDITDRLTEGENVLVVQAVDHEREGKQPAGKQSRCRGKRRGLRSASQQRWCCQLLTLHQALSPLLLRSLNIRPCILKGSALRM